jgi:hypothetical protein
MHFRVPNNRTGRAWLERARQYANRDKVWKIASRPRGSRVGAQAAGFRLNGDRDMPRNAPGVTGFAVYLREPPTLAAARLLRNEKIYDWHRKQAWKNAEQAVADFLREEREKLRETVRGLRRHVTALEDQRLAQENQAAIWKERAKGYLGHVRRLESVLMAKDAMILRISRAGWGMLAITVASIGVGVWGWL